MSDLACRPQYDESCEELAQAIECLLFAAGDPVPLARLAELCGVDEKRAEAAVGELARMLEGHGLQVVRVAGGYTLATRPEYADYVHRMRQPPPEKLSAAALEVLAIVAYRQPVTKPEIDSIRGVDSGSALRSLLSKRMITVKGRKEGPGRPPLYVTTDYFLQAFGLNDLSDLPEAPEGLPQRARQMQLTGEVVPPDEARRGGEGQALADDPAGGGEEAGARKRASRDGRAV